MKDKQMKSGHEDSPHYLDVKLFNECIKSIAESLAIIAKAKKVEGQYISYKYVKEQNRDDYDEY